MTEIQIYVFPENETDYTKKTKKEIIWRYFPILIGSLEAVPFGLMLGWPSPTYPRLLTENTPVTISFDQTAPIAGMLMFGIIFATPFSQWSPFGYKYGIVFGVLTILIGWTLMWNTQNYLWLFGSRLVVGLGHGYGQGQLKLYIKETCNVEVAKVFKKLINLYMFIGVVGAYCMGPFLSFWNFSFIAMCLAAIVLLFLLFLPQSSRDFVKISKEGECDAPNLTVAEKDLSFFEICRDVQLLKKTVLHFVLIFFQNYTSIPPLFVYTEIVFGIVGYSKPFLFAILYLVLYSMVSLLFSFNLYQMDSRTLLKYSSILLFFSLCFLVLILHCDLEKKFPFIFLFSILFNAYVHSIGLGLVPHKLVGTFFPPEARGKVEHLYIIWSMFFALTSTKIFQVLLGIFGLKYALIFNIPFSATSIIFILFCLPQELDEY